LTGVALIIIAPSAATALASTALSSSTTPEASPTAAWTVRLGLGLIDLQSPSAQISAVQRCNGLLGFAGVGHLNKRKAAGAPGFAIGDQADLVNRAVGFEQAT
jgi:hypothetical protein